MRAQGDRIRVVVAEDSLTVRRYLVDVLRRDPAIEVVGEAEDGRQAIELCQALKPDLITLDMMMPVMSGLGATEYIMAFCPTPILIVSSSTNRGELLRTYDALAAGAVDVMDKPPADAFDDTWERRFLSTVKAVARIQVITHPRARLRRPPASPAAPSLEGRGPVEVVAIGASTGGPGAVAELLRGLPRRFEVPILLVLHMSPMFAGPFTDWLAGLTRLPARWARDGEPLPGRGEVGVLVAPPDRHLVVAGGRLRLEAGPELHGCRPSVDRLFHSLALERGRRTAACLLTGMGRDGAEGLLAIRQAGGITIAQDEASSVVYGMPREAAKLGAAERILPLGEIPRALATLVEGPEGGGHG